MLSDRVRFSLDFGLNDSAVFAPTFFGLRFGARKKSVFVIQRQGILTQDALFCFTPAEGPGRRGSYCMLDEVFLPSVATLWFCAIC